jgi:hypothetical protein
MLIGWLGLLMSISRRLTIMGRMLYARIENDSTQAAALRFPSEVLEVSELARICAVGCLVDQHQVTRLHLHKTRHAGQLRR